MEYDALRMDPLYWILQKDSQVQGLQQAAINLVAKRFPGLKTRAQASIATVNDPQLLQELIPDLGVLPQGEIDEFLERLCKDQLQEEIDL